MNFTRRSKILSQIARIIFSSENMHSGPRCNVTKKKENRREPCVEKFINPALKIQLFLDIEKMVGQNHVMAKMRKKTQKLNPRFVSAKSGCLVPRLTFKIAALVWNEALNICPRMFTRLVFRTSQVRTIGHSYLSA